MEAKARGATIIHVDPRYTRTSALADLHVPIRAGTRHRLPRRADQPRAAERRLLQGVRRGLHQRGRRSSPRTTSTPRTTTGCSPGSTRRAAATTSTPGSTKARRCRRPPASATRSTRTGSASPAAVSRTARGAPRSSATSQRDETLQHPRCVFQILKRHYARYTPEMVEQHLRHPAGPVPQGREGADRELRAGADQQLRLRGGLDPAHASACSTSAARPSCRRCWATSGGPAAGSRRCAATPASRARPTSRRSTTCCPATCRCRTRTSTRTSTTTSRPNSTRQGLLGRDAGLHGQPAQGLLGCGGHAGERLLLRLPAAAHRRPQHLRDGACGSSTGKAKGYFLLGENPAVGSANAQDAAAGHGQPRLAGGARLLADRERDLVEGRPRDRDRRAAHRGHRHRGVLPARRRRTPRRTAASPTPSGCCSGTTRPSSRAGDARSDLWFMFHLGRSIREKLAGSTDRRDRPVLDLTWDYPTEGRARRARRRGGARRDQRLGRRRRAAGVVRAAQRGRLDRVRLLDLLRRLHRRRQPGGPAQAGAGSRTGSPGVGLGVAGQPADPLQPRLGRPRRQAVERAQGATSGGTRRRPCGPATTSRTSTADQVAATTGRRTGAKAPRRSRAIDPFIMQADGKAGCSCRPGSPTGRCRRTTSRRSRRSATRSTASSATRRASCNPHEDNRYAAERRRAGRRRLPLRGHDLPAHRAPHRRRHEPLACPTCPSCSRRCSARSRRSWPPSAGCGTAAGRPSSPRATRSRRGCWSPTGWRRSTVRRPHRPPGRAALPLGAQRLRHRRLGQRAARHLALDPNVHIQEVKALDLRHPAGPASARRRPGEPRARLPAAGRHHRPDRDGDLT